MQLNHTNWPADVSAAEQQSTIIMQGPHFWVENTSSKQCEALGRIDLVEGSDNNDLDETQEAELNSDNRWSASAPTQTSF